MSLKLSPRELQVLPLIIHSHTAKEVGSALGISPRTAEAHKLQLLRKLGARDTASLILKAIERGLYEPKRPVIHTNHDRAILDLKCDLAALRGGPLAARHAAYLAAIEDLERKANK